MNLQLLGLLLAMSLGCLLCGITAVVSTWLTDGRSHRATALATARRQRRMTRRYYRSIGRR